MRALISLALLLPLSARPTIEETLDLADPPLGASFLPAPTFPAGLDYFETDYGYALAVSGDFAFVGAPVIDDWGNGQPGAVHVFRRSGDAWSEIQILRPPDASSWMRFGLSIASSVDGSVLVVGSNDARQLTASTEVVSGAYVFLRDPDSLRYRFHQKLVPTGIEVNDRAGNSVDISGDWIVMGAPESDELFGRPFNLNNGSAHLFRRDPGTGRWVETQKLLPDPDNEEGEFGFTVRIDGTNLAVAAPEDTSSGRDSGRVYLYRYEEASGLWFPEADFADPNDPDLGKQRFGWSMDLAGDRLLASWEFSEDPQGHTFFFRRDAGTWSQQPTLLSAYGGGDNTHQTNSPYSGRMVSQVGNIAVTSGLDIGSSGGTYGDSTSLGEILRHEGGSYESVAILGDLVVGTTPPASFQSPVDATARAEALATDGTTILVSMMARTAGSEVRDPLIAAVAADSTAVLPRIRPLLFYEDAPASAPEDAAFAYQTLLYEGGPGSFITRHDLIGSLYGPVNREHADEAEELLRFSYPNATGALVEDYEQLFLDLAYGRAAAQLILSKDTVRNLDTERLEVRTDLFLDPEIATLETALEQSTLGLEAYLLLLQDSLGVPPIAGQPAGRSLFARHVPGRELVSPIDTDADPDSDPDQLLSGYKDLVLIYDSLRHHARTAADLVELLTARDGTGDASTARTLIGDTQRLVFEQRLLLESLFPELDEGAREELGLDVLSGSIDAALSDLAAFELNLNGTLNLLGYEPDFLMLIQNQSAIFDSFDSFRAILQQSNSALGVAKSNRESGLDAIAAYGNTQDALEAEFTRLADSSNSSIITRLTEIVGVPFGEAGYDTPTENVGSEIWQQVQSIEVARLRIQRNTAEISNLRQKVQIEQERRRRESAINSEISDMIIDFGDQQASITEEIGRIEAAQKAADAVASLFSVETVVKGVVNVVNGAVQAGAEVAKGNLRASKERLAATQDAQIRDKENEILGENSRALIRTTLLEMNTLLIDSQEASLMLRQELGRLTGLYAEQEDLERRLAEVDAELTARYFADPVHRLRALNATELANISFRNARKWLFFAARALEYKWNTPFDLPAAFSSDGRSWSLPDLFRLRNANELDRFFIALVDWDTLVQGNRTFVGYDDWFSLREDYFGYELNDDLTGDPLFYDVENPATGGIENVDAITAFRYALSRLVDDEDNNGFDEIKLRFDTLRQNELDTVTGQFQATFFSPDNYLDRLETIRVVVRGPHQNLAGDDGSNTIPAELSYLGTSVIRNETSGAPLAPDRPDRIVGEFTSYPNRFYRFFASGYQFEEGLTFTSAEALKVLPSRTRSSIEGASEPSPIEAFRERSVATSSWVLTLAINPGINPGSRLVIDEIDDVELYILHRAVQR